MSIARDALDNHGLIVGVSPERFRAVAMPLLFDHLNAQCEGTIAVNRQARIVWINDKYAEKVGIRDPASVLGKEIEEVLPASRLREVVESGQPSMIDLMAFGDEHFVVTRIPLRDEDGTLVGALGFVLFDRARHLKPLMSKYTSLQTQLVATQNELAKARRARYTIAGFIGNSPAASEIKRQARRAAQLDATVLLRGETGTGKELLAQGIHNLSPRARGPFVAVNVAAIPESLVEAELFGTAPGAFTGADRKARIGKFEVANGGTLFLDEIGDLPLPLQAKLLRVLQEQEVEPLGSNQVKALNVRVIAATHIDLEAKVAGGQFRDDLYYRLNVLALRVPPLRERASDIPAVVEHLLGGKKSHGSRKKSRGGLHQEQPRSEGRIQGREEGVIGSGSFVVQEQVRWRHRHRHGADGVIQGRAHENHSCHAVHPSLQVESEIPGRHPALSGQSHDQRQQHRAAPHHDRAQHLCVLHPPPRG